MTRAWLRALPWTAVGVSAIALRPAFVRLAVRRPGAAALVVLGFVVFGSHVFALLNVRVVNPVTLEPLLGVKDVLAGVLLLVLVKRHLRETRATRLTRRHPRTTSPI